MYSINYVQFFLSILFIVVRRRLTRVYSLVDGAVSVGCRIEPVTNSRTASTVWHVGQAIRLAYSRLSVSGAQTASAEDASHWVIPAQYRQHLTAIISTNCLLLPYQNNVPSEVVLLLNVRNAATLVNVCGRGRCCEAGNFVTSSVRHPPMIGPVYGGRSKIR